MTRRIELEYVYPHAIETVWHALTDPAALAKWFMETDLAPVVGAEFTFRTDPAPGFDGIVHCRMLEVERPRLLRFTWKGGPVDTVVTWSLCEVAGGTRLQIEQAGFGGLRAFLVSLMLKSGGKSLYGTRLTEHLDRTAGTTGTAGAAERPECMRWSTRLFRSLSTLFHRDRSEA